MRRNEPSSPRTALGPIFLTVFLDVLGFALVLPFLAEAARDTFHTSELVATLLSAVYSLMHFLFVPVWGRISDRMGRRPVLLYSVGATTLGMAALGAGLAWGTSIWLLFAVRIFSGIVTANLATANAYAADVTSDDERAHGLGLIGMTFGLALIVGPALGGILATPTINGRHGPVACFVAAALSAANFVWVALRVAESLPPSQRVAGSAWAKGLAPLDIAAMRETFRLPGVGVAVLLSFLTILSFTSLNHTFRFFTKDLFAMSQIETGLALTFAGVVSAAVQGGLLRVLSRRVDEVVLIRIGLALQTGAFVGLTIAPHAGRSALFVALGFLALGNGLSQPAIAAFVSKRTDTRSQGQSLGTNLAYASLGRTFGPALAGYAYSAIGPRSPYLAAASGMLVAVLLALALRARVSSDVTIGTGQQYDPSARGET